MSDCSSQKSLLCPSENDIVLVSSHYVNESDVGDDADENGHPNL